ncbi:MAG: 50S ribosomal protein L29 [Candidatus Hydrogenedentes bacterium]|nr:50S ribosomal protein L29 [Candidatus Hydrogenedentota bacterium]
MKAIELRDKDNETLLKYIRERENDVSSFRMQLATGAVENTRAARSARRDIARIKTILREREIAESKGGK